MVNEEKNNEGTEKERNAGLPGGPCCFCNVEKGIEEKDVDEMIDYAHENLQEMGKALESLGRSCERDVKLMFADLVSRIKHWWDILRKNEDSARQVQEMQSEIDRLRAKLKECETGEKVDDYVFPGEDLEEGVRSLEGEGAEGGEYEGVEIEGEHVVKMESEDHESFADRSFMEEAEAFEATPESRKSMEEWTDSSPAPWEVSKSSVDTMGEFSGEEMILPPSVTEDATVQTTEDRADVAVQSQSDKERTKHEIDLEAELARLRMENERMLKQQGNYCEAVQRALLRGVASLNVEALKVLRCPAIPCCSACPPVPTSVPETIVSCGSRTAKDCPPKRKTGCRRSVQRGANDFRMENEKKNGCQHGCCPLKPCGSPCCPSRNKNRKSRDEGLVFLLHQDDAASLSVCNDPTVPRLCGASLLKRIEIPACPRFIDRR